MRTGATPFAVILMCALVLGAGEGHAQATEAGDGPGVIPVVPDAVPRPVAHVVRASGPIVIDGRVDEPAWSDAAVIEGFVQSKPHLGYPATQRTEVRFLYDDDHLYIAALCFDTEPHRLTTHSLERDFRSGDSDVFGVALDTYHDRRNGFMFLVNPHGALKDVQLFDDSRSENGAWEGPIEVRTEIHEWGWSVEMAIPFSTLRFDPHQDPQVWGLQILRRVRRDNEDAFWAPLDRRDQIHRMSKAGTLEGLEGVEAGRNLSVKPYLLGGAASGTSLASDDRGREVDVGGDLKYGLTPGLSLDLTWRTDFSQVEVDDEQVNLTRFSLFFPEKREFFVENSGTFAFGDELTRGYRTGSSLRDFTLFHSRRIGLTEGGERIPILGGGRLTGRLGGVELGALNMQTRGVDEFPAENFTVVRMRRSVFGSSDIGALVVNRQATAGSGRAARRDVGVDGSFRFLDHLIVHTYLARTGGAGGDGSPVAARLAGGWRDSLWNVSAFVKHVGEGFEPAVGFVRRNGVRHSYGTVGLHPRPSIRLVQEVNPFVEAHYITDPASTLETRIVTTGFGVSFIDGGSLSVEHDARFERLREPFAVRPGAIVPSGDHGFGETSVSYSSSSGRGLYGRLGVSRGGFFNGRRAGVNGEVTWRMDHHLSLAFRADHSRITLPDTAFTAAAYGARASYGFSTKLFASAFVQYNALAEQGVTNLRLRFIHSPLSDFYLVFAERRDTRNRRVLERGLTAKVTKYLAF